MPLFWIKENKYYKIIFQPTLFGRMDVICVWGRIGGNLGNYKYGTKEKDAIKEKKNWDNVMKKERELFKVPTSRTVLV